MTSTKELGQKKDEVADKVKELGRNGAAKFYGINPSTFRDFLYKNDLPTKKENKETKTTTMNIKGDSVDIETPKSTDILDNDEIIRGRKLNPENYEIEGLVDSEWESPNGELLKARKLQLRRKKDTIGRLVLPARSDGKNYAPPKPPKQKNGNKLYVVLGDQQAPFHAPKLVEKQLQLIDSQDVHTIVNLGDTNDFPDISRYKKNPELEEIGTVQNCVNNGYDILRNQREAAPKANIVKIIGNHDVRLRDFQLQYVPQLFGLKRAEIEGIEEEPVMSLTNLMRLDELKIDLVGDYTSFEHGQFNISDYLAVRHGWYANKGAGKSALNTLEHLGYSVIVGHTHRQAIVHKTTFDIHGNSTVLCAVEIGGSCRVDITGLGFAPAPDWQQGGCTVEVWPDGRFHIDLMTYVNDELYWRDMRF
jgi:hypothetical protein